MPGERLCCRGGQLPGAKQLLQPFLHQPVRSRRPLPRGTEMLLRRVLLPLHVCHRVQSPPVPESAEIQPESAELQPESAEI